MKKILFLLLLIIAMNINGFAQTPSGVEVLKQIDKNLVLDKAISTVSMIIHSRTGTRSVKSKNWIDGKDKAFVEYTDPPREKGKKMLKLLTVGILILFLQFRLDMLPEMFKIR
jgi:hypothetical protein